MQRTVFLFLLVVAGTPALAQAPLLPFRTLGYEEGLSNSTIECIFQDSRGFIWFGTRDGLDRYDGTTMQVYRNRPGDSTSISDSYIRCIAEDKAHHLWIGTSDGLNCFWPESQSFKRYASRAVNCLLVDSSGAVWVGTDDGLRSGSHRYLDGERVNCLYYTDGFLWIGTGHGLTRLDLGNGQLARGWADSADGANVTAIREDRRGDLWLGTAEEGLLLMDPGSGKCTPIIHQDRDPSSLGGNMVKCILSDREGRVWVGCINGGLNLFDPRTHTFSHYQNDPADPSSLSQRTVSALFEDNQGDLWVGTHRGGVSLYAPEAVKFRKYPKGTDQKLTNNDVRTFYEDKEGRIWIGTDGGGIDILDSNNRLLSTYRNDPYRPGSLASDAVLDIRQDHLGRYWISTWGGGLNLFDPSSKTFYHFRHNPSDSFSISSDYVQQTLEDREGRIWVATYYGGLNLFDPGTGHFKRFQRGVSSHNMWLHGNNIVSLAEDKSGNIWVGTDDGGLNRCNASLGSIRHYFDRGDKSPDLRVLFTDQRGRLWVGQSGLYLYDPVRDTFRCYTDKAGLSTAFIKGITQDDAGNFWISTGDGLLRFNPDTCDYTHYGTGDGLQGLEFEAGACLRTRSGRMLFGGTHGFNEFKPADIGKNPFVPPVYITGCQVFNKPPDSGDFSFRKDLTLSYRESSLSFTFAALNYTLPENNRYAYILEGFDKDWHYAGTEHKAGYTNLDPGDYVFRVKAANNDGIWNELGASVRIRILPPFWKTAWFMVLAAVFLLGGAFGFYRLKRNLVLERLEERKREEIQQVQLQFFTNISHELRTPLTLILGPAERLLQGDIPPLLRHFASTIQRNAQRLLGLVNELMDFRKLETGALTLHVMPGNLDLFLEEIADTFGDWAEERKITFHGPTRATASARPVDTAGKPPGPTWFDRQVLEKIVVNLLHNAFKYTNKGGQVSLDLLPGLEGFRPAFSGELVLRHDFRAQRYACIRVADTGIGISAESLPRLFERYYRISESHLGSGIGLAFVKNLTQLHKGDIYVYSERHKGTEIIVCIPIDEGAYTPEEKRAGAPLVAETLPVPEAVKGPAPLILIVEDNDELRQFLRLSFSPQYQVAEARDGPEGWEQTLSLSPDLIVSDVMMPGISGVELCRRVKEDLATSHIPFLMLTAKDALVAKIEGVGSGADFYFTKPVSMDLLLGTIRNVFTRQQKLVERYVRDYRAKARELVHSEKDKAFMDELLGIIDTHLVNPDLDIDYLCTRIGMSRTRLYQKIKGISGQSVGEFVRTIRLKKAVEILLHEDVPFSEVMYRVGIQSQSYFTKAFKKEFGKTPTQFLQEMKKG